MKEIEGGLALKYRAVRETKNLTGTLPGEEKDGRSKDERPWRCKEVVNTCYLKSWKHR